MRRERETEVVTTKAIATPSTNANTVTFDDVRFTTPVTSVTTTTTRATTTTNRPTSDVSTVLTAISRVTAGHTVVPDDVHTTTTGVHDVMSGVTNLSGGINTNHGKRFMTPSSTTNCPATPQDPLTSGLLIAAWALLMLLISALNLPRDVHLLRHGPAAKQPRQVHLHMLRQGVGCSRDARNLCVDPSSSGACQGEGTMKCDSYPS
ncbi:hypothetical protein C0Q70_04208 [Pomacea canaliculata]|uniref:Uncharacterized protein n=1 Tax=Pomacea canaliculata TaxID=400727 RepID=A0A2T7PUW2_POMCA|nr:hypothetical protein C0Q70_04208 [Pomacea canaliculata]